LQSGTDQDSRAHAAENHTRGSQQRDIFGDIAAQHLLPDQSHLAVTDK